MRISIILVVGPPATAPNYASVEMFEVAAIHLISVAVDLTLYK